MLNCLGRTCKPFYPLSLTWYVISLFPEYYYLTGLVVKASSSIVEDPGFKFRLRQDFSGPSHTSDLKIGTPVATLPGAWHSKISHGTGQPGVSMLWLGQMESLVCNFYLNVAACKIVWAHPSLRYTCMLLGRCATNKQTNLSTIRLTYEIDTFFLLSFFPSVIWTQHRYISYVVHMKTKTEQYSTNSTKP